MTVSAMMFPAGGKEKDHKYRYTKEDLKKKKPRLSCNNTCLSCVGNNVPSLCLYTCSRKMEGRLASGGRKEKKRRSGGIINN